MAALRRTSSIDAPEPVILEYTGGFPQVVPIEREKHISFSSPQRYTVVEQYDLGSHVIAAGDLEVAPASHEKQALFNGEWKADDPGSKWSRFWKRLWVMKLFRIGAPLAVFVIVGVVVGAAVSIAMKEHSTKGTANEVVPFDGDSAIASAGCPDGTKWIFAQDEDSRIRGAVYSSGQWEFVTSETIPVTNAKSGGEIAASCIDAPDASDVVVEGPLVSVVFFDENNFLGLAYFNDGSWKTVETTKAGGDRIMPSISPVNDTFTVPVIVASTDSSLSLSTTILNANVSNGGEGTVSSVATFRNKNSEIVMFDVWDGGLRSRQAPVPPSDDDFDLTLNFAFYDLEQASIFSPSSTLELNSDPTSFFMSQTRWYCANNVPMSPVHSQDGEFTSVNGTVHYTTNTGNLGTVCFDTTSYTMLNYNVEDFTKESYIYGVFDRLPQTMDTPSEFSPFEVLSLNETTIGFLYVNEQENRLTFGQYTPGQQWSGDSPFQEAVRLMARTIPGQSFASIFESGNRTIYNYFIDDGDKTSISEVTLNTATLKWGPINTIKLDVGKEL